MPDLISFFTASCPGCKSIVAACQDRRSNKQENGITEGQVRVWMRKGFSIGKQKAKCISEINLEACRYKVGDGK